MGFVYSEILTQEMRNKARQDIHRTDLVTDMVTKNRSSYNVGQVRRWQIGVEEKVFLL